MSFEVLTVQEAAKRLKCSRARVFELLARGVLQRGAKYGRQTVVTAGSIDAALVLNMSAPQSRRRRVVTLEAELRRAAEEALR